MHTQHSLVDTIKVGAHPLIKKDSMESLTNNYAINLRNISGTKTLMNNLKESIDSPLNGTTCPHATLDYFIEKPLSVLIKINNKQAALIGFSQNINKAPHLWLTTTLLFAQHRGTGLNTELKRLTVQIAKQNNIPLGSIIRDWNIRSLKAMDKAFPGIQSEKIDLKSRTDYPDSVTGYLYNLNNTPQILSQLNIPKYDQIITRWWEKTKQV